MILMKAKAFLIVATCSVSYIHLNLTHILSVLLSSMLSVTAPPKPLKVAATPVSRLSSSDISCPVPALHEPPLIDGPDGLSNERLTQSGYMKSENPWPFAESDQDTESRVSIRSAHFSLSIFGQVLLFVIYFETFTIDIITLVILIIIIVGGHAINVVMIYF